MRDRASNYSSLATTSGNLTLTVASGEPVTVYGFILTNRQAFAASRANSASFIIYEGDGTTQITTIEVDALQTFEHSIEWLADRGIAITGEASADIVIFHSNPGL